jgi:hypothetical protein
MKNQKQRPPWLRVQGIAVELIDQAVEAAQLLEAALRLAARNFLIDRAGDVVKQDEFIFLMASR